MVKKKLNVKRLAIFGIISLLLILGIVLGVSSLIEDYRYRKTYDYKLIELGYSNNEIKSIKNKLTTEQINAILKLKYQKDLTKYINEKYFIFNYLDRYIQYGRDNDYDAKKIVSIVNVNADKDWYTDIIETDTTKGINMLVNKFNGLTSDYVPEDLQVVSSAYAYSGKSVSGLILEDLKSMFLEAKENGYTLVVSQGYRSFTDQESSYEQFESTSSQEIADEKAARAGHSDYQTGFGVDIEPYNKIIEDFNNNEEYKWLLDNSYKYGFIQRYPEGSEDICGFEFDPWRFRYVGIQVASIIHNEKITFDEYYAYYIANNN